MARLSAEEMFKNMIGRKDEEPQPAQETAAAPTAEKKKASTVQVTVRLRPEQHRQLKDLQHKRQCAGGGQGQSAHRWKGVREVDRIKCGRG